MKIFVKHNSYRSKLIRAFILVALIPLLLSFSASLYIMWVYHQTTAQNFWDTVATEKQQNINSRLTQIQSTSDTLTTYFVSTMRHNNSSQDTKNYESLTQFIQLRNFINSLSAGGNFEKIRIYSDNLPFIENDYFSFFPLNHFDLIQPGKPESAGYQSSVLSAYTFTHDSTGKQIVSFYRNVKNLRGTLLVSFCIDVAVSDFITTSPDASFVSAILAEDKSPIISDIPDEFISTYIEQIPSQPFHDIFSDDYFFIERELVFHNWKLIFAVTANGKQPINQDLTMIFLIISFLAVSFCIYAGFFSSKILTRRINKFYYAVDHLDWNENHAVSTNDLDLLVQNNTHEDEIDTFILAFINLLKKNNQLYNLTIKKELAIQKYKYDVLQEQINPHFLYNTLDTVRASLLLNKNETACTLVNCLSRFYRICLSNGDFIITLHEELDMIQQYLNIEQIGYANQISWNINCPEKYEQTPIPKFTLQPIIENAIIHGKKDLLHIEISVYKSNEHITVQIKDNGRGMKTDALNELQCLLEQPFAHQNSKHYGLCNVNARQKLLFGEDCGVSLQNNFSGGLKVLVYLINKQVPKA